MLVKAKKNKDKSNGESLSRIMPAEVKLRFRTNTRASTNGGKVPGTDWTNKGEFEFSFRASLYADDADTALD